MSLFARIQVVISFGVARGLQFLAPIAAANFLSRSDYGIIEFAHATATIAFALLSLGTLGVVPFVLLNSLGQATLGGALLHLFGVAGLCMVVGGVTAILIGPFSPWVFATTFAAVFALQGFWTYYLRSRGSTSLSLYLEALPFSIVAVAAAGASAFAPSHSIVIISCTLICILTVLVLTSANAWPKLIPTFPTLAEYKSTLQAGIPLMLGGLLALIATTSGRLGIGLLGDIEMTGTYASLSRIAALPIVAHQLAVVSKFQSIYEMDLKKLERLVLQLASFVCLTVASTLVAMPLVSPWLGSAFHLAATQHPFAALLLVAQVVLWSGISMNDLIAARHEMLPRILPWTSSTLAFAITLATWNFTVETVTVERFAIWHTGVMLMLFSAQTVSLAYFGVRFAKFWGMCFISFVGAVGLAFSIVAMGT